MSDCGIKVVAPLPSLRISVREQAVAHTVPSTSLRIFACLPTASDTLPEGVFAYVSGDLVFTSSEIVFTTGP